MNNISPTTMKYLKKWFLQPIWMHSHLLRWNHSKDLPELSTSNFERNQWRLNLALFWTNFCFVQIRVASTCSDNESSTVIKFYMLLMSALWWYVAIFRRTVTMKRKDIVDFMATYFDYLAKFDGVISMERRARNRQYCEIFLALAYYGLWTNAFLFTCLSLWRPSSGEFITSLLPSSAYNPLHFRLLFTSAHAFVVTSAIQNCGLIVASIAVYVFPAAVMVKVPGEILNRRYTGAPPTGGESLLRKAKQIHIESYLVLERFSEVFMLANGGSHTMEVITCILCIHGAVRLHGPLAVMAACIALNCLLFRGGLLSMLAEINEGSKKNSLAFRQYLVRMRLPKRRFAFWHRSVRHLPELRIRLYSGFYYDKTLVLTTMQVIVTTSASLLLTNA